jgi:hypothetical protein
MSFDEDSLGAESAEELIKLKYLILLLRSIQFFNQCNYRRRSKHYFSRFRKGNSKSTFTP